LNLCDELLIEFGLKIVVCVQHSIHVLVSLFLLLEKCKFCSVQFVLKTTDLVLKLSRFALKEALVMGEEVNFSLKTVVSAISFQL